MNEMTIRFAEPSEAGLVFDFIKKIAEYEKLLDEVICDEATIYDSVFVNSYALNVPINQQLFVFQSAFF